MVPRLCLIWTTLNLLFGSYKEAVLIIHRLIVDLVADADGELITEVEIEGQPPFVTALGMIEMARQHLLEMGVEEE